MHDMLTVLTDVRGVCLSVTRLKSAAACAVYVACYVCAGSFGATFAKCLWPLVCLSDLYLVWQFIILYFCCIRYIRSFCTSGLRYISVFGACLTC